MHALSKRCACHMKSIITRHLKINTNYTLYYSISYLYLYLKFPFIHMIAHERMWHTTFSVPIHTDILFKDKTTLILDLKNNMTQKKWKRKLQN